MRWQRRIPGFLEKKAEKKMSELRYQVVVEAKDGPQAVSGTAEFAQGPLNIACEAPEGLIRSVLAEVEIDIENDEKIFVNGYSLRISSIWTITETDSSRIIPRLSESSRGIRGAISGRETFSDWSRLWTSPLDIQSSASTRLKTAS